LTQEDAFMPWKETRTVDQRLQFLSSYQKEEMSVTDLCHECGISRPTAYKWIKRYDEVGPEGLLDLTRTPHSSPYATSAEKRKKRRATPSSQPFSMVTAPNQLWCMDFKGYFLTGDGLRCDPFTITDANSRFLIRCQAVARMDLAQVSAVCDAAMREFGVPERIRTDNGAPFAGVGLLGLSKLSLGWMKLGIVHERIQPGRPQQNGRHERMHRTLKEDTAKPPARTVTAQQKKFDRFRFVFNHERPHEALANETPGASTYPALGYSPAESRAFNIPDRSRRGG
jgi:transposase InsO family protein